MNSQITVSQQSIEKQVLVNNLKLIPDLKNAIKEFIFYDKVSQVSHNIKKYVMDGLDMSFAPDSGHHCYIEGYGTMISTGEQIRYKRIGIKCVDSDYDLRFIICYNCGNYIFSQSSCIRRILCNCQIVDLIDHEEQEEAYYDDAEMYEDEEYYNGNGNS